MSKPINSDWIATFPAIFQESQRGVLEIIEKAGFDKGIQRAAEIAAAYSLEDREVHAMAERSEVGNA